jgi:hypothetical protein
VRSQRFACFAYLGTSGSRSSLPSRDRERLVGHVLRGLGRKVQHAWRLGWWRRPDDECCRPAQAAS